MLLMSYSLLVRVFFLTSCARDGAGQLADRVLWSATGVEGLDSPLPLLGTRRLLALRCNSDATRGIWTGGNYCDTM